MPTLHFFTLSSHFLLLSLITSYLLHFPCPLARGVRSAGGAWMPATHPDRHAMTGVQTPHRTNGPSKCPPCVRCAPQGARGRVRYAQPEPASSDCVETSCVARRRVRSPLRRSTWDFWPGPVLAVIGPPSREASGDSNHPSETSCEGLSGQPRQTLRDRAPFFARVIVTRRSRSREPLRRGR